MFFLRTVKCQSERGDVAIYLSLTVTVIMLSAAILLSLVLAQQIRSTQDVVATERAFYAADTGTEEALYRISKEFETAVTVGGAIEYGGEQATYDGAGESGPVGEPCALVNGHFRTSQRRLLTGSGECVALLPAVEPNEDIGPQPSGRPVTPFEP